jgi:hypothetical protein
MSTAKRSSRDGVLASLLLSLAMSCAHDMQQLPPVAVDWKAVEQALGKPGSAQPGDVYKFGLPRTDLTVQVGAVTIKPTLALGAWLAFKPMPEHTMLMGDLVLLEDEVTPVLSKLQEAGIEQSAMHNHVFGETPRIVYMHIEAHGNAVQLAAAVRTALQQSKTPIEPSGGGSPPAIDLDTAQLDQIIGVTGKNNGGVYQFSVPRSEKITMADMEIPTSMGLGTALNFQPTGGGKAAITGDFVLRPTEVNPVIRALRAANIAVTALHSHMLTEEPRLFFMHFWAVDDAVTLARGLRAALDKTASMTGPAK